MKLIYGGPSGSTTSNWGNYLFNCTRNKSCQKAYYVPIRSLSFLTMYVDLPGKPDTYEAAIMDLCSQVCGGDPGDFNNDFNDDYFLGTNCRPEERNLIFNNYVVGQKPDGSWYGVFGVPNDLGSAAINLSTFFVRFKFIVAGVEHVYFSEQMEIDSCAPLTLLRGCYPNEEAGADATDCNGIYYGFPTNVDVLGSANYRYFHWGFVRMGSVIDATSKIAFAFFNSKKAYRSTVKREYILEFELVPTFYKNVLLGIFTRGNVQVEGVEYKLAEEQSWQVADRDSKLWEMDTVLDSECKQVFGCGVSDCTFPDPGSVIDGPCMNGPDNFSVVIDPDFSPDRYNFTFTGGVFNAGDSLEWELREGATLIDADVIIADPLKFVIDTAIHPDFDPATKCYSLKVRKICSDGSMSAWSTFEYGYCSAPAGPCHTYLVELSGAAAGNATIEYTDCNGQAQTFDLIPATSQQICALEGSISSSDAGNTTITDQGLGCNLTPVCYLYACSVTSLGGAVLWWEDCTTGNFYSTFLGFGGTADVCSRSVPYFEQGTGEIAPNPPICV